MAFGFSNELRAEIARLQLTDEEREAIEIFAATAWTGLPWSEVERQASTLRGLLERQTRREKTKQRD